MDETTYWRMLDAKVEIEALRAENERLLAALGDLYVEAADMLGYVPDWARKKWGYDETLAEARNALQGGEPRQEGACNKCGYVGPVGPKGEHPGCSYFAPALQGGEGE